MSGEGKCGKFAILAYGGRKSQPCRNYRACIELQVQGRSIAQTLA